MGVLTMTIGAVEVHEDYLRDGSLQIEKTAQSRHTLTCILLGRLFGEEPTAYRAALGEAVTVTDDGIPIFGGVVWDLEERGISFEDGVHVKVTAMDYTALLDVEYTTGILPAGTLRSQVTLVVANVVPHGITMDDSLNDGPTVPAIGYDFSSIRQALDIVVGVAHGWNWVMNLDSTISLYEPGTNTAPFPITDELNNYRDLVVRDTNQGRANGVWVRGGPHGLAEVTMTFTGDGSTNAFPLSGRDTWPIDGATWVQNNTRGLVQVVISSTPAEQTVDDPTNTGPAAQWRVEDNELSRVAGPLASGDTVTITFFARSPISIFERDQDQFEADGNRPWNLLFNHPDITDVAQLVMLAEGYIRNRVGHPRRCSFVTFDPGLEPLQTLEIRAPKRLVESAWLIENVRLVTVTVQVDPTDPDSDVVNVWAYQVECIEGNEYRGNWASFFFTRARAWDR